MLSQLNQVIEKAANSQQAELLQKFFKTGKGQYGEGDIFLGIKVPIQRQIAKQFSNLSLPEIQQLLNSKIHEKRLIALLILIEQFKKSSQKIKQQIFNLYLKNIKSNINNWDLVDLSAPNIVGNFLLDKPRNILYQLANSENLWEKRVSVISTSPFIKNNQIQETLQISKLLLKDTHDLMHKAVGWMLRESWKKQPQQVENFLKTNYNILPRTTLRYAIERMQEDKRIKFLKGEI